MKKFKCTASKRVEKKSNVKVSDKQIYSSYSFKFFARNFNDALIRAEKIAKSVMNFESLKVSEL